MDLARLLKQCVLICLLAGCAPQEDLSIPSALRLDSDVLDVFVSKLADPRKHQYSDATFEPYVKSFEKRYGRKVGDIPINFASIEKVGICRNYTYLPSLSIDHDSAGLMQKNPWKEILINRKYWENASKLRRELIIYHELGHCLLDRRHDDRRVHLTQIDEHRTIPKSLMSRSLLSDHETFRQYYYNELIDPDFSVDLTTTFNTDRGSSYQITHAVPRN